MTRVGVEMKSCPSRIQIKMDKIGRDFHMQRNSGTYLTLDGTGLIITLGGGIHATNTDTAIPCLNTTSLGQVVLTFLLANFHLLLFTTTAELIGLKLVISLELCPAVFGNIAIRHDGCRGKLSAPRKSVV